MAQNLKLDPVKKDYVFVNGSPVPSDSIYEKSYYALTVPQGKYLYGQVDQGSLLYTLQNQKRTSSIEQQFAAYASDAIKRQVIDTGDATAVAVSNISASTTGTSNEIDVTPSQTQLSNQLNFTSV